MKDRDVMEKGVRAFVSFVRAYKEHQCTYIFRWKELEAGKVARGYGLLQLPAMPEIKWGMLSSADFEPVEDIDLNSIKYKDKFREKQRQKKLVANILEMKERRPSQPKEEDFKKERRETGKKRKAAQTAEDDMEMEREYRLLKKIKRGKISENEFCSDEDSGYSHKPFKEVKSRHPPSKHVEGQERGRKLVFACKSGRPVKVKGQRKRNKLHRKNYAKQC